MTPPDPDQRGSVTPHPSAPRGRPGLPRPLMGLADLPEPRGDFWLAQGWLPRGGLAVLYGPPKAGKSLVALDLSLSIAAATGWAGVPVMADWADQASAGVLYIAAEGQHGLRRRRDAARQVDRKRYADAATTFLICDTALDLTDPAAVEALIGALQAADHRPRLIVVDTWARCLGDAEENSSRGVKPAIDACDRLRQATGATVLVLHHAGKVSEAGARGSTALIAAADVVIRADKAKPAQGPGVTLTVERSRDGPEGAKLSFEILVNIVGPDQESAAIRPTAAPAKGARPGSNLRRGSASALALEGLRRAAETSQNSRNPGRANATVWREECRNLGLGKCDDPDSFRKEFSRQKKVLIDKGLVASDGEFYWLSEGV